MSESTTQLVYITEDRVRDLLDWESTVDAVETSLVAVSKRRAIQNPRSFTVIPNTKDVLLCMPGYLDNGENGILACKMVTAFTGNEARNPPLPSILANIMLFDEKTGQLKCIIQGTEITAWRTAAASVVATKYLHNGQKNRENNILVIFGAGTQGRIHAIAFQHFFNFREVRIWNHRSEKAHKLAEELQKLGINAKAFASGKECANNADVIITATYATAPVVNFNWIKTNVHINAVGAGTNHHSELDEEIYKNSIIYVDHMASAEIELRGLEKMEVKLQSEIGEIIMNKTLMPDSDKITIFHSLGMAVEDAAVGQFIYDCHMKNK